jgi:hypothetical protein
MVASILRRFERLSRRSALGVSYCLLLAVGLLDYLTGSEASISIFYIIPVSLTSWVVSRRAGIVISIISATVWYNADFLCSPSYSSPLIPFWNALVMFCFFAGAAVTLSALKTSFEREGAVAREIQANLLPRQMPPVPGIDVSSAWIPATVVSGDYYDVIGANGSAVAFCIADVAGHGVHAALLMSNFQAAFRLLAATHSAPRELCCRINQFLTRNTGPEHFVTFFYGTVDSGTNSLAYVNAGHNNPILLRSDASTVDLWEGGIPLGLVNDFPYDEGTVTLNRGDLLVMYTDGVVELKNTSGEMFGIDRLKDTLRAHRGQLAEGVRDSIMEALIRFGGGNVEDDVTLLVLSMTGNQTIH